MLETDRSAHRPTALAAELRDALGRRQKELPLRWLAPTETSATATTADSTREALTSLEVALGRAALDRFVPTLRARGIVCVHPTGAPATGPLLNAVRARGGDPVVAAVESESALARTAARVLADDADEALAVKAIAADCTLELPLPDDFPRPRLYLCLGNTLGAFTAVGAVRTLRVLRSTMVPGEVLVLALAAAPMPSDSACSPVDYSRHLAALARINHVFGSSLDAARFGCESRYDAENRRSETHLVARSAFEVEIPGVCSVRFRKGESIRTAVSCTFDRTRLAAMLGGVGFSLRGWEQSDDGRLAFAVTCPAT
jgi:uncharacterized SAM-dependent methyltransferase